ncbi:MAG TPA: carboxypeptidase-like regulatory domain-containing protein [Planctomycetota bacterium]|nr:carboxypeptidase-like regulatory domain-containing protein [Planctomycetota bacterium]
MRRLVGFRIVLVAAAAVAAALLLGRGRRTNGSTTDVRTPEETLAADATAPSPSSSTPTSPEGTRRALAPGAGSSRGPRGGSTGISGVVVDGDTGAPRTTFLVRIEDKTSNEGWLASLFRSRTPRVRSFEGPDGAFEILDLRAGLYEFRFEAEGCVPATFEDLVLRKGRVRDGLRVKLRRAGILQGIVAGEGSAAPVAGAPVRVIEDEWGSVVRDVGGKDRTPTDLDGRFRITIRPGTLRLQVSHAEFVDWLGDPFDLPPGGARDGIAVTLRRGGGIDGFVRCPDRSPAVGGSVSARPEDAQSGGWKQANADPNGYFRIQGLEGGSYGVEASARAPGREWRMRVSAAVEEGRITRVEFPEPRDGGCTVRGRVSRGGEPIAGASVEIVSTAATSEGRAIRLPRLGDTQTFHGRTGNDGAFSIEGVPAGRAWLRFDLEPWGRREKGAWVFLYPRAFFLVVPDAPEFHFDAVLPAGEIAGRVARASDGSPAAGATVSAVLRSDPDSPDLFTRGSCDTDPAGRYWIRDFRPGEYFVEVNSAGWRGGGRSRDPIGEPLGRVLRGPVTVGEGAPVVLDVSLPEGGSALVRVRDPSGRPVPRASVALSRSDAPRDPTLFLPGWAEPEPGEEGLYRADGLEPGLYYASVSTPGTAVAFTESRRVESGEEAAFEVELREGTRVLVRGEDEDRSPVDLPFVDIADSAGRSCLCPRRASGSPRSEERRGVAVILAPGEYRMTPLQPGRRGKTTAVRVGADSPQEVVLRLEREEAPR